MTARRLQTAALVLALLAPARSAQAQGPPAPPDTAITSAPASSVPTSNATFTFASDTPSATFQCRIDATPFGTCTSPWSYELLPAGRHEFAVRAVVVDPATGEDVPDPTPATHAWDVVLPPDPQATPTPDPRPDLRCQSTRRFRYTIRRLAPANPSQRAPTVRGASVRSARLVNQRTGRTTRDLRHRGLTIHVNLRALDQGIYRMRVVIRLRSNKLRLVQQDYKICEGA